MNATAETIIRQIRELKAQSGTHSPSIATMLREIPELKIEVDACFLSNPYATDLFIAHMREDLVADAHRFRSVLEFYPPQNGDVAGTIAAVSGVPKEYIFAGNGAIEAIQAVIHRFAGAKICLPLPTFSSYYEYALSGTEVAYFPLQKEQDFALDVDAYIDFIHREQATAAILINPNNPNGGYLPQAQLRRFVEANTHLQAVIIDESFVHFAYEDDDLSPVSIEPWVLEFPNLVVIKSMSKDFGIAGIRAGYAVMNPDRVRSLVSTGYLWNVSGLADYFFKLYSEASFRKEYEAVRQRYIRDTVGFLDSLKAIDGIRVYPSKANFALVELETGISSFDFAMRMLTYHNVYVRDCSDKAGLHGEYVRIAARSTAENAVILDAVRSAAAL